MTLTLLTLLLQAGGRAASSTVPAWITLATALAAPAVAAVTLFFTNQSEANKLDHELHLEQRKERIEAYLKMALAARTLGVTKKKDPNKPGGMKDLAEALAEIQLVAQTPDVLEAAKNLSETCKATRFTAAQVHDRGNTPEEVSKDAGVKKAVKKAEDARGDFLEKARKDVGQREIKADNLLKT